MSRPVGVTSRLAIPYSDDPALLLDLHLPASVDRPPVVLYVHGGGWRRGDRSTDVEGRVLPIVETGIAVATIDYRLLPEGRYPVPLDDVRAAVRWL